MWIGFVVARAASMDATWTTVSLASEALRQGHSVAFIEPWDWEVDPRRRVVVRAHIFESGRALDNEAIVRALQSGAAPRRLLQIGILGVLMLRVAPYRSDVMSLGALARDQGVPVVNDPDGMTRVAHKGWLAAQKQARTPRSVVTRSRASAHLFYRTCAAGVVCKPARGSGGRGVCFVPPKALHQLDAALDSSIRHGMGHVVVQEYLEEARFGEKRLVWFDGELLGGYLRRRGTDAFHHNLKQGGVAEATDLTDADRKAVHGLSKPLLDAGIRLAGLDVIGDYVTEVNALNPGGLYFTDLLSKSQHTATVVAGLTQPNGTL
jgi:glutathione synthase